jgi:hypothetical protein
MQALSLESQTAADITKGFQLWIGDITAGALQNIDELIERDKVTPRESMWSDLRNEYAELISAGKEATHG